VIKFIDVWLRMHLFPRLCKRLICTSRYLVDFYQSKRKKIAYIPSEIDLSEPAWKNLPEYHPNTTVTFVYAGNPGKGCFKERLDWAIEAVNRLNSENIPCKLEIIGIAQNFFGYLNWGQDKFRNTHFYGKMPHDELLRIVTLGDYFLIPREPRLINLAGFPTKLAESWGCRVPVIATPLSNMAEYVRKDPCLGLLSDDCSPEKFYEAMKKAALVPAEIREAAHLYIRDNHPLQYQLFTEQLKDILEQ